MSIFQRTVRCLTVAAAAAAVTVPFSAGAAHAAGLPYGCTATAPGSFHGKNAEWTPDGGIEVAGPGQAICTGNLGGKPAWELVMQTDGNLVIYNTSGKALWASNTDVHQQAEAVMQDDGNFVVYAKNSNGSLGRPLWSSGTNGHYGANVCFQDDANLVVYANENANCTGAALWSSHT